MPPDSHLQRANSISAIFTVAMQRTLEASLSWGGGRWSNRIARIASHRMLPIVTADCPWRFQQTMARHLSQKRQMAITILLSKVARSTIYLPPKEVPIR